MSKRVDQLWKKIGSWPHWVRQATIILAILGILLLLTAFFAPCAKAAGMAVIL